MIYYLCVHVLHDYKFMQMGCWQLDVMDNPGLSGVAAKIVWTTLCKMSIFSSLEI